MAAKAGIAGLASTIANVPGFPPANTNEDPGRRTSLSDRQVQTVLHVLAEIVAALDGISSPAFLVSGSGAVLVESAAARALVGAERDCVVRSLARAVTGSARHPAWDVRRLAQDDLVVFLAVLTAQVREEADDDLIEIAHRRWRLTSRQTQVLRLMAHGLTNSLIAETLDIGASTVEFHVKALFDKTGVSNRVTLIVKLLELAKR
jgi:DNA-binding CsgD family transcriptional regulator